ncbi:MAG: hypothetical protein CMP52_07315 [Flavobacteriales bacterium]|jgi:hypothetical protein|nr:hypothetical protein [Candidatus Arcticimaribacter sp.]|tara:strand:+ start:88 stop:753 length:666 start_codon:yes stop_codon:yes gene_type:complete
MKKHLLTLFFFAGFHAIMIAQQTDFPGDQFVLIDGDSIPTYGIPLKEVIVFQPLHFKTPQELKRYLILRRKTLKVYPYAKMAAERLTILNKRLESLNSKRSRKKYLKRMEKFIFGEFEEELKKFSRSEGQILIRLVHRQTGTTTYDLVKELRTGWKAFWYQTTASLFKLSLKDIYDPEDSLEDYLIEDILQRAFVGNYLEEQTAALEFNLDDLYLIWKDKK